MKKYLIGMFIILAYFLFKLYVINTPTPADDSLPDDFATAVQLLGAV